MAKAPAFLFYTSDFLTGTALMSFEQKGKYIQILCLLHQKNNRLKEREILKICGERDEEILEKLKVDEEGLYYNDRLEKEMKRREDFINKQKEHGKKGAETKKNKGSLSQPYTQPLSEPQPIEANENENENDLGKCENPLTDEILHKPLGQDNYVRPSSAPTFQQVHEHFVHLGKDRQEAQNFFDYYEGLGWKKGITPIINWTSFANKWVQNTYQKGGNTIRPQPASQPLPIAGQETLDKYKIKK